MAEAETRAQCTEHPLLAGVAAGSEKGPCAGHLHCRGLCACMLEQCNDVVAQLLSSYVEQTRNLLEETSQTTAAEQQSMLCIAWFVVCLLLLGGH